MNILVVNENMKKEMNTPYCFEWKQSGIKAWIFFFSRTALFCQFLARWYQQTHMHCSVSLFLGLRVALLCLFVDALVFFGAGTACATINNYAGTPTDFLPLLAEASVVMACYSTRCAFFSKSCTPSSFFAAGRRGHVWRRAGLHSFHFAMSNEHANE